MTVKHTIKIPICFLIPEYIEFLRTERGNLTDKQSVLNNGINYSITLNSACYVEGALESGLKALLSQRKEVFGWVHIPDFYTRRTLNIFFGRLVDDLESRISRATGPSSYDDLFDVVIDQRISKFDTIAPLWEGISVLFHFRNVIAHGREITASKTSAWFTNNQWEEDFSGGYRKTEDYLLKNKLIDKRFIDSDECIYFDDRVADHFWQLAKRFLKNLSETLTGYEKASFDAAVWPKDEPESDKKVEGTGDENT